MRKWAALGKAAGLPLGSALSLSQTGTCLPLVLASPSLLYRLVQVGFVV